MYIIDTLYSLYKPAYRKSLLEISKDLARENHKNRLIIMGDMLRCSLFDGAMFTEYGDLDFFYRTKENRKTFITTYYNFKLYNQINQKALRAVFHDKIQFLQRFSDYIDRDWIALKTATDKDIEQFLRNHTKIVLKASYGDSGKEVEVEEVGNTSLQEFKNHILAKGYDLAEACIVNHPDVASFNPSSLNTVRIVTVNNSSCVSILFAGLRVGGKGSLIDNISQGGAVAKIDIDTGCIVSKFYTKKSSYNCADSPEKNAHKEALPYWPELVQTVKRAATVVPQMGIVAWDVAITPDGLDIIEGNESFGSVIMQLYYSHKECGLKPTLLELLEKEG